MHDCEFEGTDRVIRIKSRRGSGGVVEHIYARDIKARDMRHEFVILNMDYSADKNFTANEKSPVFRDMCFERIEGHGAPVAIRTTGEPDSLVRNIRFREMDLAAGRGVIAGHVKNLRFEDLRITPVEGPVFDFAGATGVAIKGITSRETPETFVKLDGKTSEGIRIAGSPDAGGRITLGDGVAADAVKVD